MNEDQFEREQENAAIGQALVQDVADWCGLPETATIPQIEKAIYKGTSCGAYIHFTETGITLGTIVEGSDAEFNEHYVVGPEYTREHLHDWISSTLQNIEDEADAAWHEAND